MNSSLQQQLARAKAEAAGAVEAARMGAQLTEAAQGQVAALEADLAAAEARVRDCEAIRRSLHNTILVRPSLHACSAGVERQGRMRRIVCGLLAAGLQGDLSHQAGI